LSKNHYPYTANTNVFPLAASGRILYANNGQPFPILGRASWYVLSLSVSAYQSYIDDTVSKGFNAIEVKAIMRDARSPNPPYANSGTLLPFSLKLNGGAYGGSFTYSNINNDAPDFTKPNESYWQFVDGFLNYCLKKGVVVLLFPCYFGYSNAEGWRDEAGANGQTKMQSYGTWIAARYRNQPNIVWMLGGDCGTSANDFSGSSEINAEQGLITGLTSISGLSKFYSAEWASNAVSTDQATFGSYCNLNGAYSWDSPTQYQRSAYSSASGPAFYLEGPYDEEGPDGTNINSYATQPVRRFQWWGWLSAIGGYMVGNGYVWMFGASYSSHLNTQCTQDMGRLNAFIRSLPSWQHLRPDGLNGIGTLVTAGKGTIDTTNYVTASCTPSGDLLVAYLGPTFSGSVTIDMTKLRGTVTARWFDPTNATYTAIGSYANTGTRAFTIPGNNSAGDSDWVLRLDA
jgi:hypothetical protein